MLFGQQCLQVLCIFVAFPIIYELCWPRWLSMFLYWILCFKKYPICTTFHNFRTHLKLNDKWNALCCSASFLSSCAVSNEKLLRMGYWLWFLVLCSITLNEIVKLQLRCFTRWYKRGCRSVTCVLKNYLLENIQTTNCLRACDISKYLKYLYKKESI